MTVMWVAVAALVVINLVLKGTGPALLGDHEFSPRTRAILDALPAAILAGLITVDLLGDRWAAADWTMLPGLGATVVAHRLKAPVLLSILVGLMVTAALRALT
jgi:uncharacterized membrane protein